jgi:hypothetical protein
VVLSQLWPVGPSAHLNPILIFRIRGIAYVKTAASRLKSASSAPMQNP